MTGVQTCALPIYGDGVIGGVSPPPIPTIESYGSTSLVQVGSNFYFYPVGGSSGPQFKYNGSPVVAGANEWSYIGVEQTASGYEVAMKIAGTDQYTVWNTDSSGNFVSNGTGGVIVSGASSVLKSLEPSFAQDLNGDGVIGVQASVAPSAFVSSDSFTFRTDLGAIQADVSNAGPPVGHEIPGTAFHDLVHANALDEMGWHLGLIVAAPDASAERHLTDLLFGHALIQ